VFRWGIDRLGAFGKHRIERCCGGEGVPRRVVPVRCVAVVVDRGAPLGFDRGHSIAALGVGRWSNDGGFERLLRGSTNRLTETVTPWRCLLASSVNWRACHKTFDGCQHVYVLY
jgi:hypothetical protein